MAEITQIVLLADHARQNVTASLSTIQRTVGVSLATYPDTFNGLTPPMPQHAHSGPGTPFPAAYACIMTNAVAFLYTYVPFHLM